MNDSVKPFGCGKDGEGCGHPECQICNPNAFPQRAGETVHDAQGISLRDYFAAKAMAEVNWLRPNGSDKRNFLDEAAAFAYEIADAMMKAREQ